MSVKFPRQPRKLSPEAIKAIMSPPMYIPAPRMGTLQEFYGGLEGFVEHLRREIGREMVLVVDRRDKHISSE